MVAHKQRIGNKVEKRERPLKLRLGSCSQALNRHGHPPGFDAVQRDVIDVESGRVPTPIEDPKKPAKGKVKEKNTTGLELGDSDSVPEEYPY